MKKLAAYVFALTVGAAATATMGLGAAGTASAASAPTSMKMPMDMPMCTPSGTSLSVTAKDNRFDTACLAVTPDTPFTIRFDNRDASRHSISILKARGSDDLLFDGDLVLGPKVETYEVAGLPAGMYYFRDEVDPKTMNGTFVVAAAPKPAAAPKAAAAPKPAATPKAAAGPKPAAAPKAATAPKATAAATSPTAALSKAVTPPAVSPAPARPAAPARSAAAAAPAKAAPAPAKAAAAPTKAVHRTAAAAPTHLPRTGPAQTRALALAGGLGLALGGLSIMGGARRRAVPTTR